MILKYEISSLIFKSETLKSEIKSTFQMTADLKIGNMQDKARILIWLKAPDYLAVQKCFEK